MGSTSKHSFPIDSTDLEAPTTGRVLRLMNLESGENLQGHVDAHYWAKNPFGHTNGCITRRATLRSVETSSGIAVRRPWSRSQSCRVRCRNREPWTTNRLDQLDAGRPFERGQYPDNILSLTLREPRTNRRRFIPDRLASWIRYKNPSVGMCMPLAPLRTIFNHL